MVPAQSTPAKAAALAQAGKRDEAIALLRRALNKDPTDLPSCRLLCSLLIESGSGPQAQFAAAQTARARRGDPFALLHEASVLGATGCTPEAVDAITQARALAPGNIDVQRRAVTHLIDADRGDLALPLARDLWAQNPDNHSALETLLGALLDRFLLDEAIQVVLDAQRARPGHSGLLHWLCMHSNYSARCTPDETFRLHADAGRSFPASVHPADVSRDPDRKLRVAYVSQDFRNRSAAHFLQPILAAHDRDRFDPLLYYSGDEVDDMTRLLRSRSAAFEFVRRLSDADLAARMRRDQIDIAVDLTGHTGLGRLGAFAYTPAPVTITYLGYPNTTGLPGMRYRIVDSITDPPGSERWASEELIRLDPCFLCYAPPAHAPAPAPPGAPDRPITFGSFNTMLKVTGPVLDLWARLAAAVPDSRFYIKNWNLGKLSAQDYLRAELDRRGVAASRATLSGALASPAEHLAAYAHVDIALDPFPYNGTTTTVEALLMGVPVVTLAGEPHRARVGASLLRAVGHPEWVAADEASYLRIAAHLASDCPALAALRGSLRSELLASPLCDGPGFTRRLEGAYREVWRRWCREAAR